MKTGTLGPQMTAVAVALGLVVACGGGGGGSSPSPVPTPTPVPAVALTATGNGFLSVHPSLQGFAAALEVPIRIQETGGGTADWNWARYTSYLQGAEVERQEVTADVIRDAGFSRIAARQNETYTLVYHVNSADFDSWDILLGFADLRDARQFTEETPFESFDGIVISLVPLSVPPKGDVRLDEK